MPTREDMINRQMARAVPLEMQKIALQYLDKLPAEDRNFITEDEAIIEAGKVYEKDLKGTHGIKILFLFISFVIIAGVVLNKLRLEALFGLVFLLLLYQIAKWISAPTMRISTHGRIDLLIRRNKKDPRRRQSASRSTNDSSDNFAGSTNYGDFGFDPSAFGQGPRPGGPGTGGAGGNGQTGGGSEQTHRAGHTGAHEQNSSGNQTGGRSQAKESFTFDDVMSDARHYASSVSDENCESAIQRFRTMAKFQTEGSRKRQAFEMAAELLDARLKGMRNRPKQQMISEAKLLQITDSR